MIPKRIFFYWSGGKLSWMRYMTLFTFRKFNPDWDITLYISNNNNGKNWGGREEQDFSNYIGDDYLTQVEKLNINIEKIILPDEIQSKVKNLSPVHESDIFRYYELFSNGGIYADMDILFFRPIDNLYNQLVENNIDTLVHQDKSFITIGFLGANKGNAFYKEILDQALNVELHNNYQSFGVDLIYSIYGTNRQNPQILDKIEHKHSKLNIFNLKNETVYNYDWTMIEYNYQVGVDINSFSNESIGYHWFGGHPFSQMYNNILSERNFIDYNTTFCRLCKNILK
jgi:hypothetical protein